MMILLIDAGNTLVKLGWFQPSTGRREAEPLSLPHTQLEEAAAWLDHLPEPAHAAYGVSVAGPAVRQGLETVLAARSIRIEWVGGETEALGVRNAYDSPGQLGADRWVGLLGLAEHLRTGRPSEAREPVAARPAILASFGTATTIDTLLPAPDTHPLQYTFRGGLILPGPATMRSSLARATAQLPEAEGTGALYPTHTHQAIVTGIAAAQAGAVLRQWLAGLDLAGHAPDIYATGGGWPLVQDETRRLLALTAARLGLPEAAIHWLPRPVLDGLAGLARRK